MVTSPVGLGSKSDSAGKAQQQLYEYITDPSSLQRGCFILKKIQMSEDNFHERGRKICHRSQMVA
jgi:hypothetical protein